MNPDELAKHRTEIGKLSVVLGFTGCVRRMLGRPQTKLVNYSEIG